MQISLGWGQSEEIREFCKGEVAHYKIPRYIEFVPEFPMTITGKIQKFVRREQTIKKLGLKSGKNHGRAGTRAVQKTVTRHWSDALQLRAEVPLVLLDVRREVRPFSPRSQKDVAELVAFRRDPGRIVERTSGQSAHAGDRFQREAEVRAAASTEFDFEPSPRFVGNVPIVGNLIARHFNLIVVEHDFRTKGRPGPALAPGAMANRHA
jgi:hypothetical protein